MIRKADLPDGVNLITDADLEPGRVKRLALDTSVLAEQLGIPKDLLVKYRHERLLHELKHGERNAGMGFSSEELAAFCVLAHCHAQHSMPIKGAHELVRQMTVKLANTFGENHVFFCLRTAGTVKDGCVVCGEGVELDVPEGESIDVFDLSQLYCAFEEAIDVEPLRLPRASSAVVPADDSRRASATPVR
jgi:hypothetical protein